jgi:hypothetical protein
VNEPGAARVDEAVTAAARQRGWVLTTSELRDLGARRGWVANRVAAGWLSPLHRGVYLVGRRHPARDERYRAALLFGGGDCLLGGWSAADWYGVRKARPADPVDIVAATHRRGDGSVVCRTREIAAHERTYRRGLPVLTVAAMLGELSARTEADTLSHLMHEAEVRKLLNIGAVHRWLAEHPRRHGSGRLRSVLA